MRRLRGMETLEPRTLLSANVGFHQLALDPTSGVYASSAAAGYTSPPAGAFTPAQIRSVYGINSITGDPTKSDGTGQTIAIIDGFDHPGMVGTADPNFINSDLAKFDAQFGLPDPPSFTKLDQNGGTNYPAVDPDGFWEQETSLDVEWAHAIAPKANLVLIEAASGNVDAVSFTALMTAVNTARNLPNVSVISMSFGFPESSIRSWFGQGAEVNYDQLFTTPTGHGGITYVAASGDTGYPGCYPAYSPNVLAIGGTKLTITNGNASEVGWSYAYDSTSGKYLGSGGGQSGIESEPSFQLGVQNTNFRQIPDVAIVGANSPGVAIYCSFNSPTAPWLAIGGTSLSTPCWAGLVAIADQLRAANGLGSLDGRSKTLPLLYSLPASDFNDILSGTNGHDVAGAGYDLVTGRGSPVADKLVPDLASFIPPPPTLTSTLTDTVPAQTTQVAIAFSGPVIGAGNVSNYQLQSVGPDGLLGTTDDVIWPLSVNVSGTTAYLTLPQLTEGVYRLTVHDGVTNLLGAKLDGNGDGAAGGDWSQDFVAVPAGVTLFSGATILSSGVSTPFTVAVGDFNRDGRPDLAVTNGADNTVTVFLANGAGGYAAPVKFNSGGTQPSKVVAVDFNHDGYLDLAVANSFSNAVSIFLGDGSGAFSAGAAIGVGTQPYNLAVADFNNDTKPDLAVVNYGSNSVTILTGDGNGGFTTSATMNTGGSNPLGVAVGDFDGDGRPDLAVTNYNSGTVGVLLATGNNSFAQVVTLSTKGSGSASVVAADINGDGQLDLAVANDYSNTIGVLLGKGAGQFLTATLLLCGTTSPYNIAAADFNGDGHVDLAVSTESAAQVFLNGGNGSTIYLCGNTSHTGQGAFSGITVADLDGNGQPDIVVANANDNSVGILTNICVPPPWNLTGAGSFTFHVAAGAYGPGELVSATAGGASNPLNGDGRLVVGGSLFAPKFLGVTPADGGQSLVTGSGTAAGLTVTRKVTVPTAGGVDFARTVDTFTNATGSAITTTVQILGNLGSNAATTVFATSNGDTTVQPGDAWIGTDDADGAGTPAVIHYIHGFSGLQPDSVSVVGDNIQWTYNLTVPAGQTVRLAYFTILGITRAQAVAAANTLVTGSGFGGQAAAFLSTAERQSLANFGSTVTGGEILDDSQPGFWSSDASTWTAAAGFNGGSIVSNGANGSKQSMAAWWFSMPPGVYDLAITYPAGANLTRKLGLDLYDGVGHWTGQILVNEQIAPADFTDLGVGWKRLGSVRITNTVFHISTWNSPGDGAIAIDAIQLRAVPIVDNADTTAVTSCGTFATTGSWSAAAQGAFGASLTSTSTPGSGSSTATWTMPVTPGTYEVDATWSAAAGLSTGVTYNVYDGNTQIASVAVNQQTAPAGVTDVGVVWRSLGTFAFGSTQIRVTVANAAAGGQVSADAVRIMPAYQPQPIVNNGNPGSWYGGPWNSVSQGLYGDALVSSSPMGSKQSMVAWWFPVQPGTYDVSVTWPAVGGLSASVGFDIYDLKTWLSQVVVNQQVAPSDFTDQGVAWKRLGTFTIATNVFHVSLWNSVLDGAICADAIRIVPSGGTASAAMPLPSPSGLLTGGEGGATQLPSPSGRGAATKSPGEGGTSAAMSSLASPHPGPLPVGEGDLTGSAAAFVPGVLRSQATGLNGSSPLDPRAVDGIDLSSLAVSFDSLLKRSLNTPLARFWSNAR